MRADLYAVAANQGFPGLPELEAHKKVAGALGAAGVTWVRLRVLSWRGVQPVEGQINWGKWPAIYQAYVREGLKLLVPILWTPDWAVRKAYRDKRNKHLFPPRKVPWKEFVWNATKRFEGIVSAWEIWNEPDIKQFFRGSPKQYRQMLNQAYWASKAASPDIEIWGPGTVAYRGGSNRQKRFTSIPAKRGKLDHFTFHDYHPDLGIKVKHYRRIKKLLKKNGRTLPISVTETNKAPGVASPKACAVFEAMSDTELADYLEATYTVFGQEGARHVFWWKVTDSRANVCSAGLLRDGLLDLGYRPKATYFRLKELIDRAS